MDSHLTPNHVSPGAFPALIFAALGSLVLGLLLPSVGGTGSKGTLVQNPGPAIPLILLVGIPMIVGAIGCTRSPVLAGLAGGAAMFLGLAIGFVWILVFVLVLSYNAYAHVGAGSVLLLICSALSVTAALYSQRFRRVGLGTKQAPSPISVLGVIATVLTVVGAIIPARGATIGEWLQFSASSILPGLVSLAFLSGLLYVGIAGFLGGRWGLGLVGGFVGVIGTGILLTNSAGELGGFFVANRSDWNPLATVGFWAMVALLVAHLVELLSETPTTTLVSSAVAYTPIPEVSPIVPDRACPFCAEMIKRAAILCRFCGHDVTPTDESSPTPPSDKPIDLALRQEHPEVSDEVWNSLVKFGVVESLDSPTLRRARQLIGDGWTADDAVSTCFLGVRHTDAQTTGSKQ